jgi:acetyl esterase/lipase
METDDEGVLDPWVVEWMAAHPQPENTGDAAQRLAMGRSDKISMPSRHEIDCITDEVVDGIPVRVYEHAEPPTGLVLYFHGGGFTIGSIAIMDNIARELAHGPGAAVVSVGYRLAPEHPYPAGLDDCERVTRWALERLERFRVAPGRAAVGGESAGGNLAAAVTLRLRDSGTMPLAAQVLLYPVVDNGSADYPSRTAFGHDGANWSAYSGGRDIDREPYAAPIRTEDLSGLPPALVVLAGCDALRDEGRAYAARLREAGVDVEDVCFAGQPHGFLNRMFPAAGRAFDDHVGPWLRQAFARVPASA